nr:PREDICTED: otoferlin-like [Bemisia tabaci]
MEVCDLITTPSQRPRNFAVVINVIEAKNLAWQHSDSYVSVKIGSEFRLTQTQRNTSRPFFNEFFTFDYFLPLDSLLEKRLTLSIKLGSRKALCIQKMLGNVRMDLGLVWIQKHHQFYHKWAPLTHPNKSSSQVQGYLKVDIAILEKGEFMRIPFFKGDTDFIQGNMLQPCPRDVSDPMIGVYKIYIYSGSNFKSHHKKTLATDPQPTHSGKIDLVVSFAGFKVSTSSKMNAKKVYWDELFTFTEVYPPMYQVIKLSVRINGDEVCYRMIFMKDIWYCSATGYLPSFGPAYIHFYDDSRFYQGSVLLAITSEKMDSSLLPRRMLVCFQKHQLSGFDEKENLTFMDYIVFGTIFEVSMLRENLCPGKDLCVSMSIGSHGRSVIQNEESFNTTLQMECEPSLGGFWTLRIGKFKPCIFLRSSWPDAQYRFYMSNSLEKMASLMRKGLSSSRKQICVGNLALAHEQLDKMMEELRIMCSDNKSLPLGSTYQDKTRARAFQALLESIIKAISSHYWKETITEKFHTACGMLSHIEELVNDPQETFPDIVLNLWKNKELISNCRISAKDILHADNDIWSGKSCGKVLTIFFKRTTEDAQLEVNGKVEIFLWLGLAANIGKCLERLPEGSEDLSGFYELPRYIRYPNSSIFECRAHIYQGQFELRNLRRGLDHFHPSIRIVMASETQTTQVVKHSVTPIWDEMLVFNRIVRHRSSNYLKEHPPAVVIELLHNSEEQEKLVGIATALPVVHLLADKSKPQYPPKMDWHSIYDGYNKQIGEILALFEYHQISDDASSLESEKNSVLKKTVSSVSYEEIIESNSSVFHESKSNFQNTPRTKETSQKMLEKDVPPTSARLSNKETQQISEKNSSESVSSEYSDSATTQRRHADEKLKRRDLGVKSSGSFMVIEFPPKAGAPEKKIHSPFRNIPFDDQTDASDKNSVSKKTAEVRRSTSERGGGSMMDRPKTKPFPKFGRFKREKRIRNVSYKKRIKEIFGTSATISSVEESSDEIVLQWKNHFSNAARNNPQINLFNQELLVSNQSPKTFQNGKREITKDPAGIKLKDAVFELWQSRKVLQEQRLLKKLPMPSPSFSEQLEQLNKNHDTYKVREEFVVPEKFKSLLEKNTTGVSTESGLQQSQTVTQEDLVKFETESKSTNESGESIKYVNLSNTDVIECRMQGITNNSFENEVCLLENSHETTDEVDTVSKMRNFSPEDLKNIDCNNTNSFNFTQSSTFEKNKVLTGKQPILQKTASYRQLKQLRKVANVFGTNLESFPLEFDFFELKITKKGSEESFYFHKRNAKHEEVINWSDCLYLHKSNTENTVYQNCIGKNENAFTNQVAKMKTCLKENCFKHKSISGRYVISGAAPMKTVESIMTRRFIYSSFKSHYKIKRRGFLHKIGQGLHSCSTKTATGMVRNFLSWSGIRSKHENFGSKSFYNLPLSQRTKRVNKLKTWKKKLRAGNDGGSLNVKQNKRWPLFFKQKNAHASNNLQELFLKTRGKLTKLSSKHDYLELKRVVFDDSPESEESWSSKLSKQTFRRELTRNSAGEDFEETQPSRSRKTDPVKTLQAKKSVARNKVDKKKSKLQSMKRSKKEKLRTKKSFNRFKKFKKPLKSKVKNRGSQLKNEPSARTSLKNFFSSSYPNQHSMLDKPYSSPKHDLKNEPHETNRSVNLNGVKDKRETVIDVSNRSKSLKSDHSDRQIDQGSKRKDLKSMRKNFGRKVKKSYAAAKRKLLPKNTPVINDPNSGPTDVSALDDKNRKDSFDPLSNRPSPDSVIEVVDRESSTLTNSSISTTEDILSAGDGSKIQSLKKPHKIRAKEKSHRQTDRSSSNFLDKIEKEYQYYESVFNTSATSTNVLSRSDAVARDDAEVLRIPHGIRPIVQNYRLEILFWGLRNTKKTLILPTVTVTIADLSVESKRIRNVQNYPNFDQAPTKISITLPIEHLYQPSAIIKLHSLNICGRKRLRGWYVIKNLNDLKARMIKVEDWNRERNANQVLIKQEQLAQSETEADGERTEVDVESSAESSIKPLILQKESIKIQEEPKSFNTHIAPKVHAVARQAYNFPKWMWHKVYMLLSAIDDAFQKFFLYYFLRSIVLIVVFHVTAIISHFSWLWAPCRWIFERSEESSDLELDNFTFETPLLYELKDVNAEDWWTKYFNSIETMGELRKNKLWLENKMNVFMCDCCQDLPTECRRIPKKNMVKAGLVIYNNELEKQPEFHEFQDVFKNYPLHKTGQPVSMDPRDNVTAIFKGAIVISPPVPENHFVTTHGDDASLGFLRHYPRSMKQPVVVRVYIVRAYNLHSHDWELKADPYVNIRLGNRKVASNRNEYVPSDLHPIFGKCFEIEAKFPRDNSLTVELMDFDKFKPDDTIGETTLDLEERYYSRYRGHCGLSQKYYSSGPFQWRDTMKPTEILQLLCNRHQARGPTYYYSSVIINSKRFHLTRVESDKPEDIKENLALSVLRRWHELPYIGYCLVPEHVETRSLYRRDKPGVAQGELEMWVDIFPKEPGGVLKPIVKIEPRKPIEMQLRVSILNTANCALKDEAIFSDKHSDLYVQGWLTGKGDTQKTDIHYYSLTGEGNFNWRFIFDFHWQAAEKMIYTYEDTMFGSELRKIPPRLHLQVWDSDKILSDDFIGKIILDLLKMPKPANAHRNVNLKMLDHEAPTINLFLERRVRGWWPLTDTSTKNRSNRIITGMLEAEIELLTMQEAKKNPAGRGHDEPNALPYPDRPEIAWNWITGIFSVFEYVIIPFIWRHKLVVTFFALVYFVVLFIYSFPGYAAKKFIGVK